jgi:hypothetical protein
MNFIKVFIYEFFESVLYDGSHAYKIFPPHFARAVAASLPLGSIRP